MYYPSVLFFFSQSTGVFNKVTELVHFSYILHSDSAPVVLEGKWRQFRNKGIVTTDMLEDDHFSAHYIPDIFVASWTVEQLKSWTEEILKSLGIPSAFNISSFQLHCLASRKINILWLLQMMPPEEVSKLLPPPSSSAAPCLPTSLLDVPRMDSLVLL